jgi:hypothetical protein
MLEISHKQLKAAIQKCKIKLKSEFVVGGSRSGQEIFAILGFAFILHRGVYGAAG